MLVHKNQSKVSSGSLNFVRKINYKNLLCVFQHAAFSFYDGNHAPQNYIILIYTSVVNYKNEAECIKDIYSDDKKYRNKRTA